MAQKHPCSDEVKEGVGEGAGAEDAREMMVGGTGDTDGAQQKSWTGGPVQSGQGKPPDVHWKPVSKLTSEFHKHRSREYIDYTRVIEEERLHSLFAKPAVEREQTTYFAGGICTDMPEKGHQYVYFDGSDPARPVMRVAQRDEEAVIESYPWDRVNFVYKEMGQRSYMCYIYTPANLNSYGLVVDKEEVYFKRTANEGPEEELTLFQIELTRKHTTIIKAVNENVGLYVDTSDGCKVKATSDKEKWNTFVIKFLPQTPPGFKKFAHQLQWRSLFVCIGVVFVSIFLYSISYGYP